MTATPFQLWTASLWNTHIRNNFLETMPGKAATAGNWFVSSGTSPVTIAEREVTHATVGTSQTRTSSSYGNLTTTGPVITTTCAGALVFMGCDVRHSLSSAATYFSVAVSGATTIAANDNWAGQCDGVTAANANRLGSFVYFGPDSDHGTLTSGSNTFTMQYRTSASTATFGDRTMVIFAM
jgi:hypothetical protein